MAEPKPAEPKPQVPGQAGEPYDPQSQPGQEPSIDEPAELVPVGPDPGEDEPAPVQPDESESEGEPVKPPDATPETPEDTTPEEGGQ